MDEYFSIIKVKPYKKYPLYTFADTKVFNEAAVLPKGPTDTFRLITVGNLKEVKNHHFLLDAFKELRNENIRLDIYGSGSLKEEIQKKLDELQLKVSLKGQVTNIERQIKKYDLFVMPSLYEGFSISVLEAMAVGMPLLLSDIPSFKEQCDDTAIYFSLNSPSGFIEKLLVLKKDKERLQQLGDAAQKRVLQNFTQEKHIEQLKAIYTDAIDNW